MTRTPRSAGSRRSLRRAATVVPLAMLSAAWTANLAAASPSVVLALGDDPAGLLPDGSSVPAEAIEAPASVSGTGGGGTTGSVGGVEGDVQQIVANSSTNGIPSAALAAYQRAEAVINSADKVCKLNWQLVAAIGRVESNHGRFGGNALDAGGLAKPGIIGLPLNGKNNTALIRDTDAGQYDADTTYDRAVGPMQFIPSTWSVVGVDADNDGVRNPQDIDDAALATAVYLCSGTDDLSTLPGQRAAVYRYNHSQSYVDLVLSIADNYLQGDFMSVPNGTVAAGYLTPTTVVTPGTLAGNGPQADGAKPSGQAAGPAAPTQDPSEAGDEPTQAPSGGAPAPHAPVTVPDLPSTGVGPVDQVLTLTQAIVRCTVEGHLDNPLVQDDAFDTCVAEHTAPRAPHQPRRPRHP